MLLRTITMFDIKNFKRNKEKVFENIIINKDSIQVGDKENIYIFIPNNYRHINLSLFDDNPMIYGLYALVTESGYYSVANYTAMCSVLPDQMSLFKYNDIVYDVLWFKPGSIIIKTFDLVQKELILYNIFDNLTFRHNVPWYLNYNDVMKFMISSNHYAGSELGNNLKIIEAVTSVIGKDRDDPKKLYRQSDMSKDPLWGSLMDVSNETLPVFSKYMGPYATTGALGSLVMDNTEIQEAELFLRY